MLHGNKVRVHPHAAHEGVEEALRKMAVVLRLDMRVREEIHMCIRNTHDECKLLYGVHLIEHSGGKLADIKVRLGARAAATRGIMR